MSNAAPESAPHVTGSTELICHLQPGWAPLIRPAPATRAWMDDTPEAFAYRCLPLNIANAHGWEVLNHHGFEAVWNGESSTDGVTLRLDPGATPALAPVSLFGQGVITFHIQGLFQTPPGWNLWIGGSPNRPKDAIQALTGVVETDWSPFTFTVNWRFTRPDQWVRFEAMEPIAFFFPVRRADIEAFVPRYAPIDDAPALKERFAAWSRARDEFHRQMASATPAAPADKWQKHYYRGVDVAGEALVDDHRAKLRLTPFDIAAAPHIPTPPAKDVVVAKPRQAESRVADGARAALDLGKRDWLFQAQERQRGLSSRASAIERRAGLSSQDFLDLYYAPGRPVILTGEMAGWPALGRWTPEGLKAIVGPRVVEYQDRRAADPDFERDKDAHRVKGPFDAFIDRITSPGAGNDAYLTAYNSQANAEALSPLQGDLGALPKFLNPRAEGMMWIGAAGSFTPLHHDLTNNFIAQVVGRKRLKLLPAGEAGRLYNDVHVFSQIVDLDNPALSAARFAKLAGARMYDLILEPGEILYVPLAWWHQVRALDFSVTLTYTSFLWPNDAHATYPGQA